MRAKKVEFRTHVFEYSCDLLALSNVKAGGTSSDNKFIVSLLKILKIVCRCSGRTFRQIVSHCGEFLNVLLYWPPLRVNSSPNQSDVPISTSYWAGLLWFGQINPAGNSVSH